MADFVDEDLQGSTFVRVNLNGSRFHGCGLRDLKVTDASIDRVELSGWIGSLVVNGVEVSGYVHAELERRHPELQTLRARDADGLRTAWKLIERTADATLSRARRLPEAKVHERVDDEWSYVETLRHLVFATDWWITGPVLGGPMHPLALPPDDPELWRAQLDVDARPTLDEVVAARLARLAGVGQLLAESTDESLVRTVDSPMGGTVRVADAVGVVLNEEWAHDRFANRDLDALEGR